MIPPEGRFIFRLVCIAGMYFYYNIVRAHTSSADGPYSHEFIFYKMVTLGCIILLMKNQSGEIPAHLQQTWDEVTAELHDASAELQQVQKRYNAAVLARIALTTAINS
jgi:hypothetical protein